MTAAHCHRHGQSAVGQGGVVALAEGKAQHPAGGNIQDRDQVQLAFTGRNLGSITDEFSKALALRQVAEALAATDPDHAERIANTIPDEPIKASALSDIAEALVGFPS